MPKVRDVAHHRYRAYFLELQFRIIVQKVYTCKTETGQPCFRHTEPWQAHFKVPHRMVVRSAVFTCVAHCLGNGFTEAYPHVYRFLPPGHACDYPQSAMQFPSEVQQYCRMRPAGTFHNAHVAVRQVGLSVSGYEQVVCPADITAVLHPYDTCGRQVLPCTPVRLLCASRTA